MSRKHMSVRAMFGHLQCDVQGQALSRMGQRLVAVSALFRCINSRSLRSRNETRRIRGDEN